MALQAGLILFVSFMVLLSLSAPISISIVISSLITILAVVPFDMSIFSISQKFVTGIDSFSLLAVPFFILSGILMNSGGIAERLINLGKLFVGRVPGSLAQTNVLGNMLFGSVSGSSVAAAAAIGGVMGPLQEKEGYDPKFSAAVNIASAPIGLIIPPTGVLIIYSLVSGGTSVAALFLAGYIPGILWAIMCMLVAFIIAKKNKYPTISKKNTFKDSFRIFLDAFPSILLIFIIMGGIIKGIFTATEASSIAVVYTFILSVVVYRSISIKELPKILTETALVTCVIMFLVASSSVMSWVMTFTGIPAAISSGLMSISSNPVVLLILMNVFLLLIGTVIDITPGVLIFTPIFLPIAESFGMDKVHFGIMLVMNLSIGNITPPAGSALFVGSSVAKLNLEDVIKPLLPFYAGIIVVLMLVTYIPKITMFLPNLFGM